MRCRSISGILIVLALAVVAVAQTKISGTLNCAKPDQFQKIDIGDKPGHAYAISQGKCTWSKPMEIEGTQTKSDVVTGFSELNGPTAKDHGVAVDTLASGDTFVAHTTATDIYKDGKSQVSEGTWVFTSATGKLKGITGKGTFKGKPDSEGNMIYDVEGTYQMPK
jgi:hypothetical protein